MRRIGLGVTMVAAAAIGGAAGVARAEPAKEGPARSNKPRGGPPAAAPEGDQTLRGPKVEGSAPTGAGSTFGSPDQPGARVRARMQFEAFGRAVAKLGEPQTREDLRLTASQQETINAAQREWRAAEQEFRKKHADELREINKLRRSQEREGRGDGGRPDAGGPAGANPGAPDKDSTPAQDAMGPAPKPKTGAPGAKPGAERLTEEQRAELMERVRRLEDQRPDPAPFQAKVWGALNDAQRAAVDAEIARIEDEALARRQQQQREAQKGKQKDADASKAGAPSPERKPAKRPDAPPGKQGDKRSDQKP